MAVDVLEHHDGTVHEHANGEGDPGKAHHVEVPAEGIHENEGPDDADGYRRRHDDRGRKTPQKNQEHRDGEDSADEDVSFYETDGAVDVRTLVIDPIEIDTFLFQRIGVEPEDDLLDLIGKFQNIRVRFGFDTDGDARLRVMHHGDGACFVAEMHARDIRNADALLPGGGDDHVL